MNTGGNTPKASSLPMYWECVISMESGAEESKNILIPNCGVKTVNERSLAIREVT